MEGCNPHVVKGNAGSPYAIIDYYDVDPDIAVDLMNDKVTLTFIIGISKVQAYNPSDFEAIADFEKISEKGLVPVEIVRQPEFVHIVHQEPVNDAIITNYIEE